MQKKIALLFNNKKYLNITIGLLLILYSFSFLFHTDEAFNQDLGRHLKLGGIIWNTKEIPSTNLFSYTYPDFPFFNHHWLFEVLLYLSVITIGLQNLLIIKSLMLLITISIILKVSFTTKSVLVFPCAYIFLHLMRGRSDLRPEIFSFLFTAVTLYILERFEKDNSKWVYVLPLISLLWVNSHIYFPLGIIMQCVFLGNLLYTKLRGNTHIKTVHNKIVTLSIVLISSIIVTLINPHFLKGALYPFTVFQNYGVTITENQTIFALQKTGFVNPDFLFYYLSLLIIISLFYAGILKKNITIKSMILVVMGVALATINIRSFPYLFLISFPYMFLFIRYQKHDNWSKSLIVVAAFLLLIESSMYLNGKYYELTYKPYQPKLTFTQDAKPAMDFVLKNNLPGPIFNNFDIGSYIIYRGHPQYKVFIDGRPEAYPSSFITGTYLPMHEDYKKFIAVDKKYQFRTIIFSITDQNPRTINFFNEVLKDNKWKLVYLDYYMIIFVDTKMQQEKNLEVINLANVNPDRYIYNTCAAYTNLSTFFANMHYYDQAIKINEKALAINAYHPGANKIMAYILLFGKKSKNETLIKEYVSRSKSSVFW